MSDELARIPRKEWLPAGGLWVQFGNQRSLLASTGSYAIDKAMGILMESYVGSTGAPSWGRVITVRNEIVAAWNRPYEDAWFPSWYATDQALQGLRDIGTTEATIALIEMAMDGDLTRAVREEYE